VVIQPLTPLPGTAMFKDYEDSFICNKNMYELWDMQHTVLRTNIDEKEFYRQIRKIYVKTIFNPFRTAKLKLNTTPPIFSRKYLRLLTGCYHIYNDLRSAHTHRAELAKTS
jgi:hypothetical protein